MSLRLRAFLAIHPESNPSTPPDEATLNKFEIGKEYCNYLKNRPFSSPTDGQSKFSSNTKISFHSTRLIWATGGKIKRQIISNHFDHSELLSEPVTIELYKML